MGFSEPQDMPNKYNLGLLDMEPSVEKAFRIYWHGNLDAVDFSSRRWWTPKLFSGAEGQVHSRLICPKRIHDQPFNLFIWQMD